MPGRIAAASVDHGLRPESAAEVHFVAQLCQQLGVPHRALAVRVEPGNVQGRAREARYMALLDWLPHAGDGLVGGSGRGPSALATAHHADDQMETMLMRLNRGSGLAGVSGIRGATLFAPHTRPVVRPLLHWRRSELAAIVRQAGIVPVDDPSNTDPDFERARLRMKLREADWLDASGFAASARYLQQVESALDAVIGEEVSACAEPGETWTYLPYLRGELHREPIWMGVVEVLALQFDCRLTADQSARIVASLREGQKVNIAGVQAWAEESDGQVRWHLAPESPRRTG